jgi:hypothetical protein
MARTPPRTPRLRVLACTIERRSLPCLRGNAHALATGAVDRREESSRENREGKMRAAQRRKQLSRHEKICGRPAGHHIWRMAYREVDVRAGSNRRRHASSEDEHRHPRERLCHDGRVRSGVVVVWVAAHGGRRFWRSTWSPAWSSGRVREHGRGGRAQTQERRRVGAIAGGGGALDPDEGA